MRQLDGTNHHPRLVDPTSKRSSPNYERIYKRQPSGNARKSGYRNERNASAVSSTNSSLDNGYKSVESYLQFYEAIPDYSELHHLSDEEFYSRLKSLKITQKRLCSGRDFTNADDADGTFASVERPSSYSSIGLADKYETRKVYGKRDPPKRSINRGKPDVGLRASSGYLSGRRQIGTGDDRHVFGKKTTRRGNGEIKVNGISDSENDMGADEKATTEECSCKNGISDCEQAVDGTWKRDRYADVGCLSDEGFCSRKSKSVPNSPGWKPNGYCCCEPHDCECFSTFRNRRLRELSPIHYHNIGLDGASEMKILTSPKKQKKFNTRPVPLLSRIPMYEKIMAEQEERRRVNHNRYSRELRSLIQPFSFTKREEEKQRMRMTRSNPELSACRKRTQSPFKAKPIPRNLFSNYAYERMKEEEFYRALKKRIRAEEMLKSSSLPSSMAARERKRRSKSLDFPESKHSADGRNKLRGHRRACEVLRHEIEFDEKNRSCRNSKRSNPFWMNRKTANSITDSSTEVSPYESVSEPDRGNQKRPRSSLSINRSNLASILRMQTTRKRMEKEMADNLEESRQKQQAKFKEKLVRMTPAWRALNYSTEEDLALRVAARREEERLRKKRYDKLMGSIYGRVHQMPPLFQRQLDGKKEMRKGRNEKDSALLGYDVKRSYPDEKSTDGNPRERKESGEVDNAAGEESCNALSAVSRYRSRNHFRDHKSSESSVTQDRSEGTKVDESDGETGSHVEEMDDYLTQQVQVGSREGKR